MRGVRVERAILIGGAHHEAGSELLIGRGIDKETASRLLREGCATAIDAAAKSKKGKPAEPEPEEGSKPQAD